MARIPASRPRELSVSALIARSIGRALAAHIFGAAFRRAVDAPILMSEIWCPRCGRVVAVLDGTRRLHRPEGGRLGRRLGSGHRDRVRITCDGCKTRFSDTSGSGVARAIRDGRPPLVLGHAYWTPAIWVGHDHPAHVALADADLPGAERL